jgi:hypothetical protein
MASGEWLGSFYSRSLQGGTGVFLARSWNKRWSADSLQEKSPRSLQVAALYSQSTAASTSPHPVVRTTGTFASSCYHTLYRKRSGVGIRGRGWRDVAGEMKSFGTSHRYHCPPAPIPASCAAPDRVVHPPLMACFHLASSYSIELICSRLTSDLATFQKPGRD